jgi:RNA polymerase-binding transcription factor DksA
MTITAHLLRDQRVVLEALLQTRLASLKNERISQLNGQSQVAAARDTLLQDADDASQQSGEYEVQGIRGDLNSEEFQKVSDALQRVHRMDYGVCVDCHQTIPFHRLEIEPQALRCATCQAIHEQEFQI